MVGISTIIYFLSVCCCCFVNRRFETIRVRRVIRFSFFSSRKTDSVDTSHIHTRARVKSHDGFVDEMERERETFSAASVTHCLRGGTVGVLGDARRERKKKKGFTTKFSCSWSPSIIRARADVFDRQISARTKIIRGRRREQITVVFSYSVFRLKDNRRTT